MIPHTLLLACGSFADALDASAVAENIALGLCSYAPGREIEIWLLDAPSLESPRRGSKNHARLRAARAVLLAGRDLCADAAPSGSLFGLATEARQSGVPAYGVTGAPEPDLFQARLLDLQAVVPAADKRALVRAGETLGKLLAPT